jgi:hypothetical protein
MVFTKDTGLFTQAGKRCTTLEFLHVSWQPYNGEPRAGLSREVQPLPYHYYRDDFNIEDAGLHSWHPLRPPGNRSSSISYDVQIR